MVRIADKSIGPFLLHSFSSRYKEVLSRSHSTPSTAASKFLLRLTKEETQCKSLSHPWLLSHVFDNTMQINISITCLWMKCLKLLSLQWHHLRNGELVDQGWRKHPFSAESGKQPYQLTLLPPNFFPY